MIKQEIANVPENSIIFNEAQEYPLRSFTFDPIIYFNENEIGKVLIEKDYPFALIKYLDENFNGKSNFNTKNASINIKKPDWIKS